MNTLGRGLIRLATNLPIRGVFLGQQLCKTLKPFGTSTFALSQEKFGRKVREKLLVKFNQSLMASENQAVNDVLAPLQQAVKEKVYLMRHFIASYCYNWVNKIRVSSLQWYTFGIRIYCITVNEVRNAS